MIDSNNLLKTAASPQEPEESTLVASLATKSKKFNVSRLFSPSNPKNKVDTYDLT